MAFQARPLSILTFSFDSRLLFAISRSSVVNFTLEGQVVSVDSTDDYYNCTLLVEPLGSQTVNFFGSFYLPQVGEPFLIQLPNWNRGSQIQDFTWPAKVSQARIPYYRRYKRFLRFGKLNKYNISLFFARRRYYIRPKQFVFPYNRKKEFAYPTFGRQFLFLPRNLHRSLFRSNSTGFNLFFHLLSRLVAVKLYSFLRLEVLVFSRLVSALFLINLGFRLFFLFKILKSCTIRRLRKRAKKALSRVMKAWSLAAISRVSFLSALNPLFFDSAQLLFALPSTLFGTYLQATVLLGRGVFRLSRTSLFYRKPFTCKLKAVPLRLINSPRYSPLMSAAPPRRRRRRYVFFRKTFPVRRARR
jgi:hypothetical protein